MRLTDNQCDELCKAILDIYPYPEKVALETFLSENFNVKLKLIVAYSDTIQYENLRESISRNKKNKLEKY